MRPEVRPPDEKSVRADYRFSPAARSVVERAYAHRCGYVILRASRESVETFTAARELEHVGLLRVVMLADVDGEQTRVYRLTPAGEEVARVVAAS